jgi:hypothetical protein
MLLEVSYNNRFVDFVSSNIKKNDNNIIIINYFYFIVI